MMAVSVHVSVMHNINLINYLTTYENFKIPKCAYCDSPSKHNRGVKFNVTCGNVVCVKLDRTSREASPESKQKMSISRKTGIANGTIKRWNRANATPSYPEQFFIRIIDSEFVDKNYIREFPFFNYSIDFAWVHKKIAVEIDGKQHEQEDRRISDAKKDALLRDHGWTIIRIKWSDVCKLSGEYIQSLRSVIDNNDYTQLFDVQHLAKEYMSKSQKNILAERARGVQMREARNLLLQERIHILTTSNIDFSRSGWVTKAAKLVGIPYQKLNTWMKKHLPEILEKSFRRRVDNCK